MNDIQILPDYIFWRKHEDSPKYDIIEYTDILYDRFVSNDFGKHLQPTTSEEYYYRKIFEEHFQGMSSILPKFQNY